MLVSSLREGIRRTFSRPKLILLLFLLGFVVAGILVLPLSAGIAAAIGQTGYSQTLMDAGPDLLLLLPDILDEMGPAIAGMLSQFFWMIPLFMLWKVASSVGVVYALQDDTPRRFWSGVSRYTGKGVLLMLPFLVLAGILAIVVIILCLILNMIWSGEVGTFWIYAGVLPTLLISALSVVALMHDFGKIALVIDHQRVFDAFVTGLFYPFRHGVSSRLFVVWFIIAGLFWFVPTLLDRYVHTGGAGALFGLFLAQQVFLFARTGASMAWITSESVLFQKIDELFPKAVPDPEQPESAKMDEIDQTATPETEMPSEEEPV